ncbi:hypothetical protein F5J12DRAFT_287904 [Pisolithus orientalis]|uniref:uncharacterized protein n=1 Tax=Pisolithus orientalis TaxID=936130 RepID=UPI0022241F0D|nr:uncharacterized protein F5J12DRAFT_287904 [Pisolithus orientalis]KAI5998996.1 hypothetical protein F5J12DRAFT_287904 [Pisolithus orientalis]
MLLQQPHRVTSSQSRGQPGACVLKHITLSQIWVLGQQIRPCVPVLVYMHAENARGQVLNINISRTRMLVAKVVPVEIDSKTLKEAVNDAMRHWDANLATTHFLNGSLMIPIQIPVQHSIVHTVPGV